MMMTFSVFFDEFMCLLCIFAYCVPKTFQHILNHTRFNLHLFCIDPCVFTISPTCSMHKPTFYSFYYYARFVVNICNRALAILYSLSAL